MKNAKKVIIDSGGHGRENASMISRTINGSAKSVLSARIFELMSTLLRSFNLIPRFWYQKYY